MARQIVNHNFGSRLARSSCALIPVITPHGTIKHLRVTPSVEPSVWLLCEWITDKGRRVSLKSVELTSEREAAGAVFLRDAYMAEEWPEGWAAYEGYLAACYERETQNGRVRVMRSREDLHFPDGLLPRAVQERIDGLEKRKGSTEWKPPAGLVRPAPREDKGKGK
jgi:hypothetical protein